MTPTRIGRTGAPPICEPISEIVVSVPLRWWASVSLKLSSVPASPSPLAAHQHMHDEQGEQDRDRGQQQEAAEQRERKDDGRVGEAECAGEALGHSTGARDERRDRLAVASPR